MGSYFKIPIKKNIFGVPKTVLRGRFINTGPSVECSPFWGSGAMTYARQGQAKSERPMSSSGQMWADNEVLYNLILM